MVGKHSRSRVSSVMRSPSIGTLASMRTSAILPLTSCALTRSSRLRFIVLHVSSAAMHHFFLFGKQLLCTRAQARSAIMLTWHYRSTGVVAHSAGDLMESMDFALIAYTAGACAYCLVLHNEQKSPLNINMLSL